MWRVVFWVAALGIIATYAFFLALDAFSISDSVPLTVLVIVLALAWVVHSVMERRREQDGRDPRLVHARERRGF
jgi:hypothetical protein